MSAGKSALVFKNPTSAIPSPKHPGFKGEALDAPEVPTLPPTRHSRSRIIAIIPDRRYGRWQSLDCCKAAQRLPTLPTKLVQERVNDSATDFTRVILRATPDGSSGSSSARFRSKSNARSSG
jgi:hypothetical protein